MAPGPLLALYSAAVVGASLCGGWLPVRIRLTHTRLEVLVSFVAGVMLGIAFLDLWPQATATLSSRPAAFWTLGGLLGMFFVERFFCWHHHPAPHAPAALTVHSLDDLHGCLSGHGHQGHRLAWGGVLTGLTLHSLSAGVALAAAVEAQEGGEAWAGLGVFLAVWLHKPLDALTMATLLLRAGVRPRWVHLANAAFALVVPAGMVLFFLGLDLGIGARPAVVARALALSAGVFLCVALSDILPELQFHHHDRWKLSVGLLAGLALVCGLTWLEGLGAEPQGR